MKLLHDTSLCSLVAVAHAPDTISEFYPSTFELYHMLGAPHFEQIFLKNKSNLYTRKYGMLAWYHTFVLDINFQRSLQIKIVSSTVQEKG